MAGGCTNTLLGRRGDFERCLYWVRNDDNTDLSEYEHNIKPSGVFYAEEVTPEDLRKMTLNGVFMFDESLITIYTKGLVNIKKGDLVKFEDELWMVASCQTKRYHNNNQFMKRPSTTSYIQLKR